jgi:hypothetical protein
VPAALKDPFRDLLGDVDDWEETAHRFHKLLRHLVLADALCQPEAWDLEPHLLVIVNELNRHAGLPSHAQEFAHFQQCLRLPSKRRSTAETSRKAVSAAKGTHLVTWQALLARAQATFDPSVRPLLVHAARLSYLQPIVRGGPEKRHS